MTLDIVGKHPRPPAHAAGMGRPGAAGHSPNPLTLRLLQAPTLLRRSGCSCSINLSNASEVRVLDCEWWLGSVDESLGNWSAGSCRPAALAAWLLPTWLQLGPVTTKMHFQSRAPAVFKAQHWPASFLTVLSESCMYSPIASLQVSDLLFRQLGLPPPPDASKTKSGRYSGNVRLRPVGAHSCIACACGFIF